MYGRATSLLETFRGNLFALCALVLALAGTARAVEPPAEPMLRIDAGVHGSLIRRIATDPDNRWIATCGDDKTVRLWNRVDGTLDKVLRPPFGHGTFGRLSSVTFSPDGNLVATGGSTGFPKEPHLGPEGGYQVYIFDRATGQMKHLIPDLNSGVSQLAYSPDSKVLAIGLAAEGLRIHRLPDFKEIARDTDYASGLYGLEFTADGRLMTCAYDGFARAYDTQFKRTAKKKLVGGNSPFSLSVAPDGTKFAVGFVDSHTVSVFRPRTWTCSIHQT